MSEPRLATGIEVSALLARARDLGGFGAVIRRGDAERGSVMVLITDRGKTRFLLQRILQGNGDYAWEARETGDSAIVEQNLARARDRDPDLWVIELDIPSPERFIAEMT